MSSLKRKHNLLDDKQKCEIIGYAKENPKLTRQQIADNLTIKWDLYLCLCTSAKCMSVELKQFYKVYLFI
jgi:hypothetical protein